MAFERHLANWVAKIRGAADVPARIVLWDGQAYDFGHFHEPRVSLLVRSPAALPYLLAPSLHNLAEAYIKGVIDLEGRLGDVIEVAYSLARGSLAGEGQWGGIARYFRHSRKSDSRAIQYHYDVSNDFYRLWLDPGLVYSCAYFETGDEDLATAQQKKIDHILTKIRLQPGHTLLDIGCGWGSLAMRAASRYGARCIGITLSENQCELARERVQAAGLADRVEIRLEDYRDILGRFDRITSVGMFEHVGRKQLPGYFTRIRELLADDGLAMNHGITSTDPHDGETAYGAGEFIDKYVFPNGELPHIGLALRTMQEGGLEAIDVENLRRHYARTLSIWADNFERHGDEIRTIAGEEKFRIWRVYLAGCAHAFQQDHISIYQVLCQKAGRAADTLPWSRRYIYPDQPAHQ